MSTPASPADAVTRPAEIEVMTGGRFVVLILDPDTAETIAAEHELGAHMGIYDESTRPAWRGEAARIAAAARTARKSSTDSLPDIGHAIPLIYVPRRHLVGIDGEQVPPC